MNQIEEFYQTQYSANWEQLVQQTTNRLRGIVRVDMVNGKEKSYNQMDVSSMQLITGRNQQTTAQQQSLAKRWLRPRGYHSVRHFDEWDDTLLGSIVLPTHEVVESQAMAYNRLMESVLIAALTGTAYTGEDGTTATVLPSSQKVAVNYVSSGTPANSGLTLAKMIKAKSILGKNEAYEGQTPSGSGTLVALVKQQHIDDMLNNIDQVNSSDYAAVQALAYGAVNRFMGFEFIRTEQLGWVDQANDVSEAIFFHRDGAIIAEGSRSVKMSIRDDLNETLQIRTKGWLGATRKQEKLVVQVACDESP